MPTGRRKSRHSDKSPRSKSPARRAPTRGKSPVRRMPAPLKQTPVGMRSQPTKPRKIQTKPVSSHHAAIIYTSKATLSMPITDLQFMARAKGIPFGGLTKDVLVHKINAY